MRDYRTPVALSNYKRERRARWQAELEIEKYRLKYLDLRKMLREYEKEAGVQFPPEIRKAIGCR